MEPSIEPVETEAPVDRKELLEQQFDAIEQEAPVEASKPAPRDEEGKFATPEKAAKKASKELEEAPAPQNDEPVWRKPPASWKKDYHEAWQKADDKLKEYAWQREEQMRKGVEPLLTKAQFADAMQEAINPFLNTINGLGIKPEKAVQSLMQADHYLRYSQPQQKLQYFVNLARQYGVDLSGQPMSQAAPNAVQPGAVDPNLYNLYNELTSVKGQLTSFQQMQEQQQNQALYGEIEKFAQKAEHFEDARPTMIQLLNSGMAQDLEDAYDKAIRLNPDLFDAVNQARQAQEMAKKSAEMNRAAKNARAAAVSVRSSTPGTNTASKAQDRRSLLAEQFDGLADRV